MRKSILFLVLMFFIAASTLTSSLYFSSKGHIQKINLIESQNLQQNLAHQKQFIDLYLKNLENSLASHKVDLTSSSISSLPSPFIASIYFDRSSNNKPIVKNVFLKNKMNKKIDELSLISFISKKTIQKNTAIEIDIYKNNRESFLVVTYPEDGKGVAGLLPLNVFSEAFASVGSDFKLIANKTHLVGYPEPEYIGGVVSNTSLGRYMADSQLNRDMLTVKSSRGANLVTVFESIEGSNLTLALQKEVKSSFWSTLPIGFIILGFLFSLLFFGYFLWWLYSDELMFRDDLFTAIESVSEDKGVPSFMSGHYLAPEAQAKLSEIDSKLFMSQKSIDEAQQMDSLKQLQVMGSVLSDRIKRPVSSLLGEIEWSLSEKDFGESKKHIKNAKKEITKLKEVASELNLFSYTQSQKSATEFSQFIQEVKTEIMTNSHYSDFQLNSDVKSETYIKGSSSSWSLFFDSWLKFANYTQNAQIKKSASIKTELTDLNCNLVLSVFSEDWSKENVERFLMSPDSKGESLWFSIRASLAYLSQIYGDYEIKDIVNGFEVNFSVPVAKDVDIILAQEEEAQI